MVLEYMLIKFEVFLFLFSVTSFSSTGNILITMENHIIIHHKHLTTINCALWLMVNRFYCPWIMIQKEILSTLINIYFQQGKKRGSSHGKLNLIETYVFLNSVKPKVGKLSNPQESPIPLKNHLKQLQTKLMLRYFPRHLTCFL